MSKAPFILLVNPWITDFAAYDLWSKPLGLLLLGSLLREGGCGVYLLDCLDRHDAMTLTHPEVLPGKDRKYGTGKYPRMPVKKPGPIADIPRHYYRYGIHPGSFERHLRSLPKPDLVCVTSIMTYWYPGVCETIDHLRGVFPETPVWLGGIYARLCTRHAHENSGADEVITLSDDQLADKIEAATGFHLRNRHAWGRLDLMPSPALDLLGHLTYAPLLTSRGCAYQCPYCASHLLQPKWERRNPEAVYGEIAKWHSRYGIVDFAFYDDALLLGAEHGLKLVLERICLEGPNIRFHTPNAIHIRALTSEWCHLLHESGFTTIRLGLETTRADKQQEWGGKVETAMFLSAVTDLLEAGFSEEEIGVYLLCGLPGQTPEEVAEAIRVVHTAGAQPYLAEYSPVPGTPMWSEATRTSVYDLNEPLYHNNTYFACRRPEFSYQDLLHLKKMAQSARRIRTTSP